MAVEQYKEFEIDEMSMIELAYELLLEQNKPVEFHDLVEKIAEMKRMNKADVEVRIAQFYTDMNIDGRFIALNDNHWGLTRWYPYNPADEDLTVEVKKKKKKKKAFYQEDEYEEDIADDFGDDDVVDELDDVEEDDEDFEEEDLDYEEELIEEDDYDLDIEDDDED